MKTPTPVVASLLLAWFVSAASAATPLTEKIGTVPPDIFHAMSGNFSAARGYTGNLTLLVPASTVNAGYRTTPAVPSTTASTKTAADAFKTPLNWTSTPLKPLMPVVDPATNRTVPSSSR